LPHRRVGRVTVDDSDGDVTIRLGAWNDEGRSVNRQTALGTGAFATATLTAIGSIAAGELILLLPTIFLGMAGGAAWAGYERRRQTVVEVRARGTVLHLLDRRGRIRREIPIDSIDQVGIGRDDERASLWVQRGMEREPIFLGLEAQEAALAADALDRRVQLPKEPYR